MCPVISERKRKEKPLHLGKSEPRKPLWGQRSQKVGLYYVSQAIIKPAF